MNECCILCNVVMLKWGSVFFLSYHITSYRLHDYEYLARIILTILICLHTNPFEFEMETEISLFVYFKYIHTSLIQQTLLYVPMLLLLLIGFYNIHKHLMHSNKTLNHSMIHPSIHLSIILRDGLQLLLTY